MADKKSSSAQVESVRQFCRACVDFKSWVKQNRKQQDQYESNSTKNASPGPSSLSTAAPSAECPLDKNELGRNSWGLLHSMAAYYPEKPTEQQSQKMKQFIELFADFYPCDFCAADMRNDIKEMPPDTASQRSFARWMCQLHNRVNRKMGKAEFDCSMVDQRWRDGWKDGSCD